MGARAVECLRVVGPVAASLGVEEEVPVAVVPGVVLVVVTAGGFS